MALWLSLVAARVAPGGRRLGRADPT